MLPTMVPVRSTLDASQNKVLRHEARSAYGRYGSNVVRGRCPLNSGLPPSADLLSTLETLTQPRQHRKGCERLK